MNKTILSARAVDNFPINQVNGQNGSFATTNGSIAVMRPRGRRDANGNYPTDFFYVEATGKTAEQLGQVNKGDKFFAEGYFYNDSFTDREGAKRTLTKFRIDRVERETADVKKPECRWYGSNFCTSADNDSANCTSCSNRSCYTADSTSADDS